MWGEKTEFDVTDMWYNVFVLYFIIVKQLHKQNCKIHYIIETQL